MREDGGVGMLLSYARPVIRISEVREMWGDGLVMPGLGNNCCRDCRENWMWERLGNDESIVERSLMVAGFDECEIVK